MKVAAVDVGSNSIHLIVCRLYGPGVREVLDREKEMVQLGRSVFRTGRISKEDLERAVAVLKRFRAMAEAQGAETILAVATAAVREARNRSVFLRRVEREARLALRVLSGAEEGRLIYAGARDAAAPSLRRLAVIDIGGGSVEVILGEGLEARAVWSLKLGGLRLEARFPDRRSRRGGALEDLVRSALRACARRIRAAGTDAVLGTSGTVLTLADLLKVRDRGRPIRLGPLEDLERELLEASPDELERLSGVGPERAGTIGFGALVLRVFMEEAGIHEVLPCEKALREGLVADYARRRADRSAIPEAEEADPRRRSVFFLARRLGALDEHARRTAALATKLFDELAPLHGLGGRERELLEYAALLHDAGYWVGSEDHHKHAYYMISRAPLEGFARDEIRLMALTARYHRGPGPRKRHKAFASLPRRARRRLKILAALLRVADALDRSHAGLIRDLAVRLNGRTVDVDLAAAGEPHLELHAADRRGDLFRKVFGRELRFTVR